MRHAFDSDDAGDRGDDTPASFDGADEDLASEGFEEGEAYDEAMGDELDGLDDQGDELAQFEDADAGDVELDAAEDEVETAWLAFEEDVADAMDVEDTDE